jgi:hypothetical protein
MKQVSAQRTELSVSVERKGQNEVYWEPIGS